MLENHNEKDRKHLVSLIGRRSNDTPNFALLIGAGTSASSGVKTSSQMIVEWRQQLYEQSKSSEPLEKWLEGQDWYKDAEEYSILFEKICDQRSQRRIYIEECVKDAKPSWGYIYLANIIGHKYFNVIFTPNFDDLLNEACCIYADLRPMVCAHDSAVVDVRVTSARPKILKLHGDFLYDSIKNTVKETMTLEQNMRDKFMQFAREYGLIIIGYGGNDRSIMDILDVLLSSEGYFPNGLYWCRRKGDKVSKRLDRLMQREESYWVEIEGFDEFMAELHEALGLVLPNVIRDPYKATSEMLNRFILPEEQIRHPVIKEDILELEKEVKKFEKVISGKESTKEFDRLVPYRFLGDREYNRGKYKNALHYYKRALLQNPKDISIMYWMAQAHVLEGNFKEAFDISEKMINEAPADPRGYWSKGYTLIYSGKSEKAIESYNKALKYIAEKTKGYVSLLISRSNALLIAGSWEKALADTENALRLSPESSAAVVNKCVALIKLGRKKETEGIIQDFLPKAEDKYGRAGAFAALGDKENMLIELKVAIKEYSGRRLYAKFDPEFADYREDPDFRKLVYEGQE